jgi:2-methylisocitrate lyase-like PEP mutase family enzyme
VLARGQAYLAAGAATVFVLPGQQRKITRDEIAEMVKQFDGRLNIGWNPAGALSIKELADLGVARVSVGPVIHMMAMNMVTKTAEGILTGVHAGQ